jgi:ethanolamine utilization protein EutQ (cupin superfamily)
MIHIVKSSERNLLPLDIPGVPARACDAVLTEDKSLSAGFSEYTEACSFEWTFDHNEVFYMLEGELTLQLPGGSPVHFTVGDMGHIEKGAKTLITVKNRAYFLHVTFPAWTGESD